MSKFTVDLSDHAAGERDTCALLGVEVRRFIEKVTGRRVQSFVVPPEKMSLEWLRDAVVRRIALELSFAPTEIRTYREIEPDVRSKYGLMLDAWLEDNVDLVCEVKMIGMKP